MKMVTRSRQLEGLLAAPGGKPEAAGTGFLANLTELVILAPADPREAIPPPRSLADHPEPIRIILVLNLLGNFVRNGGLAAFLEAEEAGAYLKEAHKWCARLSGKRAAAYLKEASGLFSNSHVPNDPEKRRVAVHELTSRVPDPLSALDEKYRGAVDEIPELFREYLRLHSEPVHDWFRATSEEARVRKPPTLAQVLSRAVPRTEIARQKFMHALTELIFARPAGRRLIIAAFDPTGDARQVAAARGRIPERVQMIVVLNGLWTELCGSGAITQFLAGLAGGDDLHAAERWCRRIGARRMASYLRAAARLFPEAMDRSPDPFAELDDKYESAVNEIPVALHAYLKRYQGVLERWLEVAGPSSDRGVRAESGKQARQ